MKKVAIALALATALMMSGCASVWKTLGVQTIKAQDERESALRQENDVLKAQVAELKATVDRLSVRMDDIEKSSADVERIEALVDDLQERVDLIPQETLQKLADILARAAKSAKGAKASGDGTAAGD